MIYRIAADLVLVTHFAFIILVVAGGLVVFRYAWFVWIHIPVASWGAFVELTGRHVQLVLAGLVIAVNVIIYTMIVLRNRRMRQGSR